MRLPASPTAHGSPSAPSAQSSHSAVLPASPAAASASQGAAAGDTDADDSSPSGNATKAEHSEQVRTVAVVGLTTFACNRSFQPLNSEQCVHGSHTAAQVIARLRRQLKEEQRAHHEARSAFVAEATAREALSRLLHTCAACLQPRLATLGTASEAQPANTQHTGGGLAHAGPEGVSVAAAAVADPAGATPRSCRSNVAVTFGRAQLNSTPHGTPVRGGLAAMQRRPGSATSRLNALPPRRPPSAQHSHSASDLMQNIRSPHRLEGDTGVDVEVAAAAAVAALCGRAVGSKKPSSDAGDGSATTAWTAKLVVIQWLSQNVFGAERMAVMHNCQRCLDSLCEHQPRSAAELI